MSLDWLLGGRGEPFLEDGRPVDEDPEHDRDDVLDELTGLSRAVERRLDLLEEMGDLTQEEARPLRASLERLLELGDG